MNKTVTVNLGGTVFHIDENAYEALIKYLNSIKGNFSTEDGRDEIMQDIESRISEMFRERIKDVAQVITLQDVNEVTALMGRPEQFEESENKSESSYTPSGTMKRRLFRNPDDKLIGGVCSGLSAYLDVDPVWIRLAWALLFFLGGSGLLIYIVLWIIVPEAKTTADRLQMRGEPVTIENIGKNVKEEMESVKSRMTEGKKSAGTVVGRIFQAIGEIIKFIFVAIGKIIAFFFILIGFIISIVLFICLFGILFHLPFVHYPIFFNHIFGGGSYLFWTFLGIVLALGIPFLLLMYAGVRMLFKTAKLSRMVTMGAIGLMVIGWVLCFAFGSVALRDFSKIDNVRKEIPLAQPAAKMIYLESDATKNKEKNYGGDWSNDEWNDDFYLSVNEDTLYSRNINLDVVKSPTDSFDLVELFYANGSSRKAAIENASHIIYSFSQSDSVIKLPRNFRMEKETKWRNQKVQLLLRVPVGAKVRLDENLIHLIHDIDNVQNVYDNDMLGRTWIMTDKGLSCVDCTGLESTIDGTNVDVSNEDVDQVNVNEDGVHIVSKNGDKISIDSNGVLIHEGGKDIVKLKKKGVLIHTEGNDKK